MFTMETYQILGRQASRTWPSQYAEQLGEWLLRATPSLPSRRANSVLAAGDYPDRSDWLEAVEQFYRAYRLPPRFHISNCSPSGLDAQLEKLGYRIEYETLLMAADCETVISRAASDQLFSYEITMQQSADPNWTSAFMQIEQFDMCLITAYQQMMDRIQGSKTFASVRHPVTNDIVAIGTAVREKEWAGLINIATDFRFRRQGIGLKVIEKLAEWTQQQGARSLYLQVLANNEIAQRLYRKLGFEKAFGYHYRTAPLQHT